MQQKKQLCDLLTPLKDGWSIQIFLGKQTNPSNPASFEEYDDHDIDSDAFFNIHAGILEFWKATGTLPVKGDIISDPVDNSTVLERWVSLKDKTLVFFLC